MFRTITTTALLLIGAAGLAGCASNGANESASQPSVPEVSGQWGDDAARSPFVRFDDDGTLTGNDGCNGFTGTYAADERGVSVTLGISTLKACLGVDTWLRDISSATVDGDSLRVYDAAEKQIGTLERVG